MTHRVLTREELADAMEKGAGTIREAGHTFLSVDYSWYGYCGCANGALLVGIVGSPSKAFREYHGEMHELLGKYGVPRNFSKRVDFLHIFDQKSTGTIVRMIRAGELDKFLVEAPAAV
ncbi:hypothetical protein L0Y69_03590 [bacterium]|nr:hypothetical protein [bacterium]